MYELNCKADSTHKHQSIQAAVSIPRCKNIFSIHELLPPVPPLFAVGHLARF